MCFVHQNAGLSPQGRPHPVSWGARTYPERSSAAKPGVRSVPRPLLGRLRELAARPPGPGGAWRRGSRSGPGVLARAVRAHASPWKRGASRCPPLLSSVLWACGSARLLCSPQPALWTSPARPRGAPDSRWEQAGPPRATPGHGPRRSRGCSGLGRSLPGGTEGLPSGLSGEALALSFPPLAL